MARIYTDACLYNGVGGIGIYCETGEMNPISMKRVYSGMTSNTLEANAVQEALAKVGHLKTAIIYTDSMYVIDCLVKYFYKYESASWLNTKNLVMPGRDVFRNCHKLLRRYKHQGKSISVEYIKGHSGVPGNVQADRLAGLAAGKPALPDYVDEPESSNNVAVDTEVICPESSRDLREEFKQDLDTIILNVEDDHQEMNSKFAKSKKAASQYWEDSDNDKSEVTLDPDIYWTAPFKMSDRIMSHGSEESNEIKEDEYVQGLQIELSNEDDVAPSESPLKLCKLF